ESRQTKEPIVSRLARGRPAEAGARPEPASPSAVVRDRVDELRRANPHPPDRVHDRPRLPLLSRAGTNVRGADPRPLTRRVLQPRDSQQLSLSRGRETLAGS